MFLTVNLPEGRFVVDPGFGGPAALFPIPLMDSGAARPGEATHWMTRDDGAWLLRTQLAGQAVDAWVSTLEEDNVADFEMANHFTSTHLRSPFRNRLMMSLFRKDGRVSVMNRDVTVRQGEATSSSKLADREALRGLLVEHFGFDLPEVARIHIPAIPEWE